VPQVDPGSSSTTALGPIAQDALRCSDYDNECETTHMLAEAALAGVQSDMFSAAKGTRSSRSARHRPTSISVCLSTVKGRSLRPATCTPREPYGCAPTSTPGDSRGLRLGSAGQTSNYAALLRAACGGWVKPCMQAVRGRAGSALHCCDDNPVTTARYIVHRPICFGWWR